MFDGIVVSFQSKWYSIIVISINSVLSYMHKIAMKHRQPIGKLGSTALYGLGGVECGGSYGFVCMCSNRCTLTHWPQNIFNSEVCSACSVSTHEGCVKSLVYTRGQTLQILSWTQVFMFKEHCQKFVSKMLNKRMAEVYGVVNQSLFTWSVSICDFWPLIAKLWWKCYVTYTGCIQRSGRF